MTEIKHSQHDIAAKIDFPLAHPNTHQNDDDKQASINLNIFKKNYDENCN